LFIEHVNFTSFIEGNLHIKLKVSSISLELWPAGKNNPLPSVVGLEKPGPIGVQVRFTKVLRVFPGANSQGVGFGFPACTIKVKEYFKGTFI